MKKKNSDDQLLVAMMLPILSMFGPFALWPLETLLGFPIVLEEMFKLFLVFLALKTTAYNRLGRLLRLGLVFGVSESFLFLFNANMMGGLSAWSLRLWLTVPMHMLTLVPMYLGNKASLAAAGRGWIGLVGGFVVAVLIHYGFNWMVR